MGSAVTGADGDFTITLADQSVGGIFEAVFAGDTSNDYSASTSAPVSVEAWLVSTVDASYTVTPQSTVTAGGTVTFSGTAFVPADDNDGTNPQTPVVGANVYVYSTGEPTATSPHATTDGNGAFSVSFKPTATAVYHVAILSSTPSPYSLYVYDTGLVNTTITVLNPAPSPVQTRIESFQVPATYEIHGTFNPTGTAQELNGTKWQGAPSATVALYDRSLPNGNWVYVGPDKASSTGAFAWKYEIHKLGSFAWQARVEQTTVGCTEYKASDGAAKDSLFVDRTYVTHFVAMHLNGHTSIGALIEDYPRSGGAHYANVTGIAKFYEPTGSKSWRYLGESRATSANHGSVAVAGRHARRDIQDRLRGSGRLPRLKRHALPHLTSLGRRRHQSVQTRVQPAGCSRAGGSQRSCRRRPAASCR